MKDITAALSWRYATKKFDENKMVGDDDITKIKEILRLTPSSFGLQPWKFVIIKNKQIQKSLVEHSWNQNQVAEASHLIVLCRKNKLDSSLVDDYINDYAQTAGIEAETLDGYKKMMVGFLENLDDNAKKNWADKQIYIALGSIMTDLANMGIDSCPMEGFISEKYDEILGLKEKGISSVVLLPIGYRSEEDETLKRPKIRFKTEDLFVEM